MLLNNHFQIQQVLQQLRLVYGQRQLLWRRRRMRDS